MYVYSQTNVHGLAVQCIHVSEFYAYTIYMYMHVACVQRERERERGELRSLLISPISLCPQTPHTQLPYLVWF